MIARHRGLLGCAAVVLVAACADDSETICKRTYELVRGERYADAVAAADACLARTSRDAEHRRWALTARAYAQSGLAAYQAASLDYDAAFAIRPVASVNEAIGAALSYRSAGRLEDSLTMARAATVLNDGKYAHSMPVRYHLGWTLQEMGRHEEAIAEFTAGLPAQPTFAHAYWRRALSLEALARPDDARADLLAARSLFVGIAEETASAQARVLATYLRLGVPPPDALTTAPRHGGSPEAASHK